MALVALESLEEKIVKSRIARYWTIVSKLSRGRRCYMPKRAESDW